jgi:F-type H+-transporting ATPase subunit b
MIIDWYTIIFQIINFMILVFLLRRFLYGPIMRMMDEREQKILERETEAAARQQQAEQAERDYSKKSADLQEQEETIIDKARSAAEDEKKELLDTARREVDQTKRRWEDAFKRERETFISELRHRVGQQACLVARRCLQDLSDAKLEALAWDLFLKKLASLPETELKLLRAALAEGKGKVTLRSAFEASAENISALKKSLKEKLPNSDSEAELSLTAKQDTALICGLELSASGYALAWSIDSYLGDLESEILKELDHPAIAAPSGEVSASGETGN